MILNRNKVKGLFVGGAIGDALGMPVEGWSAEKIAEKYSRIEKYLIPVDHKYYSPEQNPAGSTTDDTQLTRATALGLMHGGIEENCENDYAEHYLEKIAKQHVCAMKVSTVGWGSTTRDSIRRLSNNVSYKRCGKTDEANRGLGNGVSMKCSPIAAWYLSPDSKIDFLEFNLHQFCVDFSSITHWSKISAQSTICHVNAILMCLNHSPSNFSVDDFCSIIGKWVWEQSVDNEYDISHLNDSEFDLQSRMEKLVEFKDRFHSMNRAAIIAEFGNGSCSVYESLPFSYAWFLKNPHSFSVLEEIILSGGDTDTNAKIVGEMLGALHGFESIKTYMPWAVEQLKDIDSIIDLSEKFCDIFGIKE